MNKRSKLLEAVFKSYGGEDRTPPSANDFFMEVLKLLTTRFAMPFDKHEEFVGMVGEVNAIMDLFNQEEIEVDALFKAMEKAKNKQESDYLDTFVFTKIMRELELFSSTHEGEEITCLNICQRILASPTKIISNAIKDVRSMETDDRETGKDTSDSQSGSDWSEDGVESEEEFDKLLAELFGEEPAKKEKKVVEKPTMSSLMDKVDKVRTVLTENVFGQDHAVSSFVSGFFQSELTATVFENRDKPRATFLFAGPPGVGKTYLSELAAQALGLPFKRFDMSEYSNKESSLEFAGSDKVYKNGAKGNVTSFVEENPHCVLLFDEIEKAHLSVIYLFLQILDAGRLRDNFSDKEISFKDAIIILTTNAGRSLYEDESINLVTTPKKTILKALGAERNPETREPLFPMAICSRFASGNVVMFNRMQGDFLLKIAANEMKKQCDAITKSMGVDITFDSSIPYAVLFSEGGKADARTIKARSIKFIYDETYELLRLMRSEGSPYDVSALKSIKVVLSPSDNKDVTSLFEIKGKPVVLVYADKERSADYAKKLKGVELLLADNIDEAKEILDTFDVTLTLCDVTYNTRDKREILNREDINSEGMDFFDYIASRTNIPLYIIQLKGDKFSDEELQSFASVGSGGVFDEAWSATQTGKFIKEITLAAHLKKSMGKLARANKVLSFGTAQTINNQGEEAVISLYDLKLTTAVDAEDNKNVLNDVSRPSVRFADVIGAKDAKGELKYFIDYLKDPIKYVKKGIKAPKGILLYGPPGTGKTMLAKAMAGESNVTFIKAEGNQFLKQYVGQGSESVHKLFTTARKYAPSILFIDEIDAIAKNRQGSSETSASDVLTAFLTEMDGFTTDKDRPVFVLAATNFGIDQNGPRSLDPALLRRFDRRIYIDLPDKEERTQFIDARVAKLKNHSITREAIENLAVRSTGSSLAELDSVFELALRNVIKVEDGVLSDKVLEEAFETFSSGEVKKWDESELLRTARHEAGHTVVCWASGEKPSYLTIVARADHGGYMQFGDNEKKGNYTRQDLLAKVRTALGGRAAEIVYYGEEDGLSSGASGDLQSATAIMKALICNYGMDEKMGLCALSFPEIINSSYYSQVLGRINERLSEEFEKAKAIIEKNRAAVDRLVEELMSKNALKGSEIEEVLKDSFVK